MLLWDTLLTPPEENSGKLNLGTPLWYVSCRQRSAKCQLSWHIDPLVLNLCGHCLTPHCKENPIYVLPEKKLRGLSPNFHIHVSVLSDLYIPRIHPPISCRRIGRPLVEILYINAHRNMNEGYGSKAAQFHFWKYLLRIFGILSLQCIMAFSASTLGYSCGGIWVHTLQSVERLLLSLFSVGFSSKIQYIH
jgi:hypothetical protein